MTAISRASYTSISSSGESPLARKHNIGFRCALGFCDVVLSGGGMDVPAADASPEAEEATA